MKKLFLLLALYTVSLVGATPPGGLALKMIRKITKIALVYNVDVSTLQKQEFM